MTKQYSGGRLILSVALWTSATAVGARGQWQYYYFDDPQPLVLDTSRVAVQARKQATATATSQQLAKYGITTADVKPLVIPRWTYAPIEATAQTNAVGQSAAASATVTAMATGNDFEFVSPVFVDDRGFPLLITRRLFVGFRKDVTAARAQAVLQDAKAGVIQAHDWSRMPGVYDIVPKSRNGFEVLALANALAKRPEVRFAQPDMIITGTTGVDPPNDALFGDCWGLHNTGQAGGTPDMDMDALEAWDISFGEASVVSVVMDTGVQQTHPDLNQVSGFDATGSGTGGGPLNQCDGHGTTVAGTISAIVNNGIGVSGIAPNSRVGGAKIGISNVPCDGTFLGFDSWMVSSLDWAQSIGARVTNASISRGPSALITNKYISTHAAGMVHFASAGNGGGGAVSYPSSIDVVNSVAALDRNGNKAGFSQFGVQLQFSAPGVAVCTTDETGAAGFSGTDYATVNGTSYASPYSTGVAALILSVNPTLTPDDVKLIMEQGSVDLGAPGRDDTFGWGFLNANNALLLTPSAVAACGLQQVTASDAEAGDFFGNAVANSGDVVVAGAPRDDDLGANAGSVYIYRWNGSTLAFEQKITTADAAAADFFGGAVSVSGDVIVAGAAFDDDGGANSGSAYVFRRIGGIWQQEQKLTASDAAASDFFGASISLSGGVAVVGARTVDCAGGGQDCGAAYVYRFNGATWDEEQKLTASDAMASDQFGGAVSVDGDVIAVGANRVACAAGSGCGATYAFRFNGASWDQEQKLQASDGAVSDFFGQSVSVSGTQLVAGAPNADCGLGADCGAAYTYDFDGASWGGEVKLTASREGVGDAFGDPVSVDDNILAIGARGDTCGVSTSQCGAVFVFRRELAGWIEDSSFRTPDIASQDKFAQSVSVSGSFLAVGIPGDDCPIGSDCGQLGLFAVVTDCNNNGTIDTCDILLNPALDGDNDRTLDACVCTVSAAPQADVIEAKNRYLSFSAGVAGSSHAIRVQFDNVPPPHTNLIGTTMWVGPPTEVSENGGSVVPIPGFDNFMAATLSCAPFFADWTTFGTVHVSHQNIIPGATFSIQTVSEPCEITTEGNFSPPLALTLSGWGDVSGSFDGGSWAAPDGSVDVIVDIISVVSKFGGSFGAPIKARADLEPATPDRIINISDAVEALSAFQGRSYPFETIANPCGP